MISYLLIYKFLISFFYISLFDVYIFRFFLFRFYYFPNYEKTLPRINEGGGNMKKARRTQSPANYILPL